MSGTTDEPTREQLLAQIVALKAQLAAKPATVSVEGSQSQLATLGGIASGNATNSLFVTGSEIHGDVYVGQPTDDPREALAIYRRVLFQLHHHLVLRGIVPPSPDRKAGDGKPELAQVYVALDTKSLDMPKAGPVRSRGEPAEPSRQNPLSALDATIRNRRLVLLGDPGSGKSTFVTHLGLCLAAHALYPLNGWLSRLPGWPEAEASLLPICVVLRDFARSSDLRRHSGRGRPDALLGFLREQLKRQNLEFAAKPIEKALESGQALLIFDGLDEIPVVEDRQRVRDAVQAFSQRYPGCRLIATCRTLSYQLGGATLEGLPSFELAPFDPAKIARFVEAWYEELGRLRDVRYEDVPAKTAALKVAVQRPDIQRLAPNPLLLAVMAAFHAYRGRLPDQRAELYEETIKLLLWTWDQVRTDEPGEEPPLRRLLREAGKVEGDLYRALASRAFQVHMNGGSQGDGPADIREKDLENDLAALHPEKSKDWATKVIETIRLRAGLLVERTDGVFAFPHRTFQEYLAGAHLAGHGNFASEALALAKRDLVLCREVLLLAVGKQKHVNNEIDRPLHLASKLCPDRAWDDPQDWRRAVLAGEVLVEIGQGADGTGSEGDGMCQRISRRLVTLIEGEKLPARERATAGDVLAAIGDPRFRDETGWCLPADEMLGFVEIPEGPFLMGSDKKRDKDALDRELPQHRVELPAFLMARLPVTVAQFRAFLRATGTKLEDENGLRMPATRPMTYVSLEEALDYCAWLDKELRSRPGLPAKLAQALALGKVILPSEAEWEKAARGTDGRIYPWGNEWNPERANAYETGIGNTSAVGCFGAGKSPFACEEMSGNVWEWTRSRYQPYPYPAAQKDRVKREAPGGDEFRVVRGGCFIYDRWSARAAFRNGSHPAVRSYDLGFRVVVSPSFSDP